MLLCSGCRPSQTKQRAARYLPANDLMTDRITTVPKARIGERVRRLGDEDMVRLNRAVLVFLGIATPSDTEQLES